MLKLRRIEILGFKSFSDRGEISVTDAGVTAIVGPNGCGKSNVSDAIAWVLGEQSAKSLRGEKMEDVIFNGTRSRKPMGMAEVTITLTQLPNGNGHGNGHGNGDGNGNGHGNGNGSMTTPAEPSAHRPLLSKEGSDDNTDIPVNSTSDKTSIPVDSRSGNADTPRPLVGPKDIVVQRRLYRSGESMYLIDGKPCRLRDIQDIFLGTGLGPNSYAIIEQGRVGQLLSSKPTDRRGLIEEAAGITKFKAKRKLAESRLEAARQNLSRVNDILAEVDRQRNSLKRQAGKARRYIELRDRMRHILSSVFSTRAEMLVDQQEKLEISLGLMGSEGRRLEQEIERLNALVHQRRIDVGGEEKNLEQMRERRSEIELEHEKAIQRVERLQDQIRALEDRKISLASERDRAIEEIAKNGEEREARTVQLSGIDDEKQVVEADVAQAGSAVSDCAERRNAEERSIESLRQQQFETVGREARLRNEANSRQDSIFRISAQIDRLQKEEAEAREQASVLDQQLSAAREDYSRQQLDFGELKVRLQEAEESYSKNRLDHAIAVKTAAEAKTQEESIRHRLQTIGDLAVQRAYSTESVQQFFNAVRGLNWAPLGILADFVEVEHDYEALVEDFLRWKLQYVVVQDRGQAERAIDIVKTVSKGRLDCLVLNAGNEPEPPLPIEGARPLAEVVKFGEAVRHFSEYIRDAYIVDTVDQAWDLARQHPHLEFVARTGEVVRGHVVSWGEHEDHGPLSLKREIRELDAKMDAAVRHTALMQDEAVRIEDLVHESEALKSRLLVDLQEAEKTMLSTDHRVRSLAADVDRAQQRWRVATGEVGRLSQERNEVEKALKDTEFALAEAAARKAAIEEEVQVRSRRSDELRAEVDNLRHILSGLQSKLAVLQERRSTVARELNSLVQQAADLERRSSQASAQIGQAQEQQEQTRETIESLEVTRAGLSEERNSLDAVIAQTTAALDELRRELHEAEAKWDETRALLDTWKDRHNALEIERTQVESDLKHLAESCIHELNETIEAVCLKYFEALPPTELEVREQEYRELRDKIDSMGAVNMMAVEEHQEAEERFVFLSTQRQDLLDSIRDTTQAIDEIDAVCRRQFKEAFEAINAGFKDAFVSLFGGGHGELRLLEGAEETDAGVEIVASPPGKKLQNVLLLSGGEKALTALALLIALFRYKPSPFCVLDEVDAPLDEANVDRFAQMVRDMSATTQFIVITHSKRTMETASQLYGVTMEEPGISKIVSVRLN
jgi:chromosome segregation protein